MQFGWGSYKIRFQVACARLYYPFFFHVALSGALRCEGGGQCTCDATWT